jgi:hypothetical protein
MIMSSEDKSITEDKVIKKDHNKKFYEDHPELLTEKITCSECGLKYLYCNKSRHYKSQKHKLIVTSLALEKLKKQIKI